MEAPKKYRIMAFKDFVPDRARFWLLFLFAVIFQFSGGIYLASVSHMVGGKTLLQEDIMMAGYASFVGMTIAFPLLFRFKFRFTSRTILLIASGVVLLCNLVSMHTDNLPLLVFVCFIAGFFRMLGTFECFSSIQLVITPTRDFTVFFPAIYLIILGSIQLSGIATTYLTYFSAWEYMHVLIIGLLLFIQFCVVCLFRDFRFMKKLPLYGIDWSGALLWSVCLLSVIFVFQYGKYLDWFDSIYIRMGVVVAAVTFLTSIYRMVRVKRPFIELQVFRYKNVVNSLLLYFVMMVLLSTPTVLENAFTGGILAYDSLNSISLNWLVLAGIIIGICIGYIWFSKMKWPYKPTIFFGFACISLYMGVMYFLFDPGMNIEALYLPSVFRGIGYGLLYVALTFYMSEGVPFPHFFQMICVIGFIRSGIASPIGSSLFSNWMQFAVKKNTMLLSSQLDPVNPLTEQIPLSTIYGQVMRQATLVSIKEIMGWMVILSIVVLVGILCTRYFRPVAHSFPKMKKFRQYIKGKYRLSSIEDRGK